jgi:predicted transcriptional regulator
VCVVTDATAALTIRLDADHRDKLAVLASKHDRSVAYFARIAIERFLREVERDDPEATRA